MYPWQAGRDELREEAGRQDVVTLGLQRALQDVGDRAIELYVEVLVYREAPDPLAAFAADFLQPRVQVGPVGECPAVAIGYRVDAGAGERREVEQQARPLARGAFSLLRAPAPSD